MGKETGTRIPGTGGRRLRLEGGRLGLGASVCGDLVLAGQGDPDCIWGGGETGSRERDGTQTVNLVGETRTGWGRKMGLGYEA